YDARDRVTQLKVFDGGSTVFMQQDYVYDRASEITGVTDNMYVSDAGVNGVSNPKTITYEYNGNGRLQKAVGPFGASQASSTLKWTYDQVGNLQTAAVDASTYTYTVTGWNRLDSLSLNGMSFTYNAAGSLLTKVEGGSTTTYTHDFQQQLTKTLAGSNTYTYSYDGLGRRVTNVTNVGPTSYFLYAGDRMLYSKVGTPETAYVYVGSDLLLRSDRPGRVERPRGVVRGDRPRGGRLGQGLGDRRPERGERDCRRQHRRGKLGGVRRPGSVELVEQPRSKCPWGDYPCGGR